MANIRYFPNSYTTTKSSTTLSDIYDAILENDDQKTLRLLETPFLQINEQLNISRNPYKYTLLHHAIDRGSSKAVIKKLLLLGADLNIKDKKGRNCYDLLSHTGNGELVKDIYSFKEEQIEMLQNKLDTRVNNDREKDYKIQNLNNELSALKKVLDETRLEKQNLYGELNETRKRKDLFEVENTELKNKVKKFIKLSER